MFLKSILSWGVLFTIVPIIWSETKLFRFMMALDKNITDILSNPTSDQGEPLLYNLDEYITRLRDVNHLLKFSPKFMYKTAKSLHKEGAPLFLHAGLDTQYLHDTFQWEDFKTEAVSQYINDIRNYTRTFSSLFSKLSVNEFDKYDYESHDETETDVEVEELGNYLVDLDKKILRLLILPEKNKGDMLLEMLEKFWKNFRYIDGLVVLNEQKAFRPAKLLLEKDCPTFVQEAFDVLNLQSTYNWRSKHFSAFKEYLLIIAGLAQKFKTDFTKMQVDVDTLFERPFNNENI